MSAQHIRVLEKSFFTDDILRLRLRLGADQTIEFKAGQYILLGLDREELKPFSIATAPDGSGQLECHIRKNIHSPWMQKLFSKKQGETLYWQGPIDHVSLADKPLPTIFVAGGTGFALMKALLEKLLESLLESQPTYPIHIYWGARHTADLYQHDWLVELSRQHDNIDYTPVISEQELDWQGATGQVHKQVLQDTPKLEGHLVYLCGPPDMQRIAKQDFLAAGLDEKHFIS